MGKGLNNYPPVEWSSIWGSTSQIAWSESSQMPESLPDSFTKQDILDLLEFLRLPMLNVGPHRK
jgi:hypothetical protein